jgi:hypothetical protein
MSEPEPSDVITLPPGSPGLGRGARMGFDVAGGLRLRLGDAMAQMASAGLSADQQYAQEIRVVPVSLQAPVVGGAVTFASSELGPKTGFVWAVQSGVINGLLPADNPASPAIPSEIGIYVGQPQPQNQRYAATYAAPNFNPGRTDMILNYGDFLTAQTLAGAPILGAETVLTMNLVVAIMATRLLPSFLM